MKLNNLNDVRRIVDEYYTKTGDFLEHESKVSRKTPEKLFGEAKARFVEGSEKLRHLKLLPKDRQNFSLLRETFNYAIKSCEAGEKGNYDKAVELMEISATYAARYSLAVSS